MTKAILVRSWAALLVAVLVGCAGAKPAQERSRRANDPVSQAVKPIESWREEEVSLPPYPREEHLAQFLILGTTTYQFYVDTDSVSVGEDGVVRYTLVARSSTGAENVSFEGIRCETQEYKIFALGSLSGTWSPATNLEWRPVERVDKNDFRFSLFRYYVCLGEAPQPNTKAAVLALKRGRPQVYDGR